jgi:DNA-binding response OmpR family regulator
MAKAKIFVVEDNEDTRHLLELLLQASGYEVEIAGNMADALRDAPGFGADILLSDLGLPDGDGWQLIRALREAGCTPYAIAMSGFGTLADVTASKVAGFRHHLVKPIDWNVLKRLLEEACHEREGFH